MGTANWAYYHMSKDYSMPAGHMLGTERQCASC